MDTVSILNKLDKNRLGITAPMEFHLKRYGKNDQSVYSQLNNVFTTNEYKVVFILDPISEVDNIKKYFERNTEEIKTFFDNGGSIIFSAPIQTDFETGSISEGNRGIDSYRDILSYLFGIEYLPKIYNPGPSKEPFQGNKCILTSKGKKIFSSLDGSKGYKKDINYNGVLTLPLETKEVYDEIGNIIDLINPILTPESDLDKYIDDFDSNILSKKELIEIIEEQINNSIYSEVSVLCVIRIRNGLAFLTNINPKQNCMNEHSDLFEIIVRLTWYSMLVSSSNLGKEFNELLYRG